MMAHALITHARLMSASEDCVEQSLRSEDPQRRLIASRILDDPAAWRRWEIEHTALMRSIADHRRAEIQIAELKNASFQLVHTKAPFDHLREQRVRGEARRRLVAHLHPSRSYSESMVHEHSAYLRAACSLLCTSHVGVAVAHDGVFEDPMRRYEELYSDYFRAYCDATVGAANDDDRESQRGLLPYLKLKLAEYRRALLRMPPLHPGLLIEPELRQKTGDTQKLRRPTWFKPA
jgi:hypothetical protein